MKRFAVVVAILGLGLVMIGCDSGDVDQTFPPLATAGTGAATNNAAANDAAGGAAASTHATCVADSQSSSPSGPGNGPVPTRGR